MGAALLGRIDNNNSREITSLVVEPCGVCKRLKPSPNSSLHWSFNFFVRSPTIVSSSSSFGCCYTFWVVVVVVVVIEAGSSRSMFGSGRRDPPHTHTADVCVCVCRGGYGTTLTHLFFGRGLRLFSHHVVVVVVVCPRNHGASVFFSLSSVR